MILLDIISKNSICYMQILYLIDPSSIFSALS